MTHRHLNHRDHVYGCLPNCHVSTFIMNRPYAYLKNALTRLPTLPNRGSLDIDRLI
ncbi:hypothetical protein J3U99_18190 [Brucella pituitosa]|uniref:hypothetical protein n=1 Tax=Brucella pituitosa TaxID=571256 RepID=UPI0012FE3570|nr:hypothetical protein [Brucella pituitosa]MCK4206710.1 hypothetical protein [Brucella pituitosa]